MNDNGKFTPGPWSIDHRRGGPLTGLDAELAEIEDCEPFALSVIEVKEPRFERTFDSRVAGAEETAIANAHLIAAAPELYTALKAARHALRSYQYGNTATDLAAEVADFASVALAKAEGRS